MSLKFLSAGGSPVIVVGVDTTGKTFTGKAPAGASVAILKNGTQDGTATADASGLWSYTFATAPAANDAVIARALVSSPAFTVPAPVPGPGPSIPTNALTLNGEPLALGSEILTLGAAA